MGNSLLHRLAGSSGKISLAAAPYAIRVVASTKLGSLAHLPVAFSGGDGVDCQRATSSRKMPLQKNPNRSVPMEKRIGLFDMDGTLFDYESQLRQDLRKLMAPGEVEPESIFDESLPHVRHRLDLIKSQPGWWRGLPRFPLGWDVHKIATEMGFDIHILTKGPRRKPMAWMEKVQCVQDHFGLSVNIDIVGKDKSARYGHFLVDDWPSYVEEWLKHRPRGLVIMPAHPYNRDFSHPNVIRYDGTNLPEVRSALEAVQRRKPTEHWREALR
jgi:hypothetical protein